MCVCVHRTPEGVVIPEVLRPFMGGMEIMKFTQKPPKASDLADKLRNQSAPDAAVASASASSASASAPKADGKVDQ